MVGPRPKLLGPKLVPIDFAIFCPGGGEPKMEPKLRFCLGQPKMEPKLRVGPIYGKKAVLGKFSIFSVFSHCLGPNLSILHLFNVYIYKFFNIFINIFKLWANNKKIYLFFWNFLNLKPQNSAYFVIIHRIKLIGRY